MQGERRRRDGRQQEVQRNSDVGTTGWGKVSNKTLLFYHHFSNRRLTLWFESSLRRGGRYRPTELEGKRYRPAILAAINAGRAAMAAMHLRQEWRRQWIRSERWRG